jgi:hypothetical protein
VCVSGADDALDLDGVVRHLLELNDEPRGAASSSAALPYSLQMNSSPS